VKARRRPRWQQATALVSLSTAGAVTGLSFAHGSAADLTSPTGMPVKLLAMDKPVRSPAAADSALRSAIVKAAQYYLRLAQSRSPSDMEEMIWQNDSIDGVDHGESCAAFATLMLESGAQATGQQSWVTGGTTYPWPVHTWVDARVDPNPASPGITSILQDAQAHNRWHPLGDGYTPQPGDFVLFDNHVEVVTKYAGGVLDTIGGDSLPNMSVNAHQYDGPLAAQGVAGFVNNGALLSAVSQTTGGTQDHGPGRGAAVPTRGQLVSAQADSEQGQADIPGTATPTLVVSTAARAGRAAPAGTGAQQPPVDRTATTDAAVTATATIPGAQAITGSVTSYSSGVASRSSRVAGRSVAPTATRYSRSQVAPSTGSVPATAAQQAFLNQVVPGAQAAQRQYGIPAAVTIAQAIDESGWGQSQLAAEDNNLFGIKGTGPAGSVALPTEEYEDGQPVAISAQFRVYSDVAQSINDHSLLLATGSAYQQAMADRRSPDAFANDLTGVYATDPNYGASLITIMQQYNLYRFDAGTSASPGTSAASGSPRGGPSQSASGQRASAQRGRGQSSRRLGSAGRLGTQPGSAGQGAAIPGAVQVNATALGMAAQQAAGPKVTRHAPSGAARTVRRPVTNGTGSSRDGSGQASIPGLDAYAGTPAVPARAATSARLKPAGGPALQAGPRTVRISTRRYVAEMPRIVTTDFITTAKIPLLRAKPVYQEVAAGNGIRWELLAACDWMQCQAQPGISPVHGEKLGTRNADGTVYRTKVDALEQCASDLVELAAAVYGINLRHRLLLSVRDLANVFAAFRWGGLLKAHRISAMEFPYSVEGLTGQHMKMRWPDIGDDAPDKAGSRFRMPFGAVPVVLRLNYPAIA
jgi:flagellum-specific peptidoglycan hydrolase FlgJ